MRTPKKTLFTSIVFQALVVLVLLSASIWSYAAHEPLIVTIRSTMARAVHTEDDVIALFLKNAEFSKEDVRVVLDDRFAPNLYDQLNPKKDGFKSLK
jgi:hypothetical protein